MHLFLKLTNLIANNCFKLLLLTSEQNLCEMALVKNAARNGAVCYHHDSKKIFVLLCLFLSQGPTLYSESLFIYVIFSAGLFTVNASFWRRMLIFYANIYFLGLVEEDCFQSKTSFAKYTVFEDCCSHGPNKHLGCYTKFAEDMSSHTQWVSWSPSEGLAGPRLETVPASHRQYFHLSVWHVFPLREGKSRVL